MIRNTACTKLNIRQRVVGIGQRKTVIVCRLIVFQGVDFCRAASVGSKTRYGCVAIHLREKPIVAFLGRSALNTLVVGVGRNVITVCRKGCR